MEIKITTGTYNTSDYSIVKQYKNEKVSIKDNEYKEYQTNIQKQKNFILKRKILTKWQILQKKKKLNMSMTKVKLN